MAFPTYLRAITTPTVRPWVPEPHPDYVDYEGKPMWRFDAVPTKNGNGHEGLLRLGMSAPQWVVHARVAGQTYGLLLQSPRFEMTALAEMYDRVCRLQAGARPSGELYCCRIIAKTEAIRPLLDNKSMLFIETRHGLCVLRNVRTSSHYYITTASPGLACMEQPVIDCDGVFPAWDAGGSCSFTE